MKKAMILASVASMIDQFNMNNIDILLNDGYEIDVVADFENGSTFSDVQMNRLKEKLTELGVHYYHVPIPRSLKSIGNIFKSYKTVKQMCKKNKYDILHCHSPIGGVIARLAASSSRKNGTCVIYTAHGFHFFDGAPKKNWLIFYPVEKFCSRFTDLLITINKEDYKRAEEKFYAKDVAYVPGIGVDLDKFSHLLSQEQVSGKRRELGIGDEDTVVLSIGELNKNKNHSTVIKAIGQLKQKNKVCYLIAGRGKLEEELKQLADKYEVNLKLLGFRDDIPELLQVADIYIHPSHREGMSVSTIEAVASKTLVLASNIRGTKDLVDNRCLFESTDCNKVAELIEKAMAKEFIGVVDENYDRVGVFSRENVNECMRAIYKKSVL